MDNNLNNQNDDKLKYGRQQTGSSAPNNHTDKLRQLDEMYRRGMKQQRGSKRKKFLVATTLAAAAVTAVVVPVVIFKKDEENRYEIIIQSDAQNFESYSITVARGATISHLRLQLNKLEGHKLIGIYKDQECTLLYDDAEKVTKDTTIYLKFEKERYSLILPEDNELYTIQYGNTVDPYSIEWGSAFSFWINPTEACDLDSIKVYTSDSAIPLTPKLGEYRIDFVDHDMTIIVEANAETYTINIPNGVTVIDGEGNQVYTGNTVRHGEQLTITYTETIGWKKELFTINGHPASNEVTINSVEEDISIVYTETQLTYQIALPATTTGYTIEEVTSHTDLSKLTYGAVYSFKLDMADSHDQSTPLVKVNGKELTASEGVYTVSLEQSQEYWNNTTIFEITVDNIEINTYNITLPTETTGYSLDIDRTSVEHGQAAILTLQLELEYSFSTPKIKLGTEEYTGSVSREGDILTYEITNITKDIAITVENVEKTAYAITAPAYSEAYTIEGLSDRIEYGKTEEFTLTLKGDYTVCTPVISANDKATVTQKGKNGNTYTFEISQASGAIDLTVDTLVTLTVDNLDSTQDYALPVVYGGNIMNAIELALNGTINIYEQTCGFYTDAELHNPVLSDATITDNITIYTRQATLDKLKFEPIDNGKAYSVSAVSTDIAGLVVLPVQHEGEPVTTITDSAFSECSNMSDIVIPHGVTTIIGHAFQSTTITSLYIPATVTTISTPAGLWYLNNSLTRFIVSPNNPVYSSRAKTVTGWNGNNINALIEKQTSTLLITVKDYSAIPNGVKIIESGSLCHYWGEQGYFTVDIPESVVKICQNAFRYEITSASNDSYVRFLGESREWELSNGDIFTSNPGDRSSTIRGYIDNYTLTCIGEMEEYEITMYVNGEQADIITANKGGSILTSAFEYAQQLGLSSKWGEDGQASFMCYSDADYTQLIDSTTRVKGDTNVYIELYNLIIKEDGAEDIVLKVQPYVSMYIIDGYYPNVSFGNGDPVIGFDNLFTDETCTTKVSVWSSINENTTFYRAEVCNMPVVECEYGVASISKSFVKNGGDVLVTLTLYEVYDENSLPTIIIDGAEPQAMTLNGGTWEYTITNVQSDINSITFGGIEADNVTYTFELNGETISSGEAKYGSQITYSGDTQVVDGDSRYTIIGWQYAVDGNTYNSTDAITLKGENNTFTAQCYIDYMVRFVNDDDSELERDWVGMIGFTSYTGVEPTKEPDGTYMYEFAGWTVDGNIVDLNNYIITEPTTFVASYNAIELLSLTYELEEGCSVTITDINSGAVLTQGAKLVPWQGINIEVSYNGAAEYDIAAVTDLEGISHVGGTTYMVEGNVSFKVIGAYSVTTTNVDGSTCRIDNLPEYVLPGESYTINVNNSGTGIVQLWINRIYLQRLPNDNYTIVNPIGPVEIRYVEEKVTLTYLDDDRTTTLYTIKEHFKGELFKNYQPTKAADAQYSYTFSHWEDESDIMYAGSEPIYENMTFYAVWNKTEIGEQVTVYVDDNEQTITVDADSTIEAAMATLGLNYENTCGFYSDAQMTTPYADSAAITEGITIYTKTATIDKLNFTEIDTSSYSVSARRDDRGDVDITILGEIVIPKEYNGLPVTAIAERGFSDCGKISSMILPYGILTIEQFAFEGCLLIKNIYIPATVTKIDRGVLESNTITNIVVSKDNSNYTSRNNAGDECNAIIRIEDNKLVSGCKNTIIPDTIRKIEQYAFDGCSGVTSINLPNEIEYIGVGAFRGCSSLISINIPAMLKVILEDTFNSCTSLNTITIPAGVLMIKSNAFAGCTGLTAIDFADNVGWSAGETIILSSELEDGNMAATYLTDTYKSQDWERTENALSVKINNYGSDIQTVRVSQGTTISAIMNTYGYTNENTCGFYRDIGLKTPLADTEEITDGMTIYTLSVTTAMADALEFTLNEDNSSYSVLAKETEYDGFMVIPKEYNGLPVTAIAENGFKDCTSITSATLPYGITTIEVAAFYGCFSMKSVNIPNSVTDIKVGTFGESAFFFCSSLESIYIPDSVISLGNENYTNCFAACSSLKSIIVDDNNAKYTSKINGEQCNAIVEIASNTLVTGCNTSSIADGITAIGSFAFVACNDVESISIPSSVTTIEENAFQLCENLTTVTLAEGLSTIGRGAFASCSSLINITLPTTVTRIKGIAFNDCKALTDINIPAGVTVIGLRAFDGCTNLGSVDFANKTDWTAGTTAIAESDLENAATAATYLRETYNSVEWTKKTIAITVTADNGGPVAISAASGLTVEGVMATLGYTLLNTCGYFADSEFTIPHDNNMVVDEGMTIYTKTVDENMLNNFTFNYMSARGAYSVRLKSGATPQGDIVIPAQYDNGSKGVANVYNVTQFTGCTAITSVTLPYTITSVSGFSRCANLSKINIHNNITSIGSSAFTGCKLTSIYIPASVTSIGSGAFAISSLNTIVVDSENSKFTSLDDDKQCNVIINKTTNTLLATCINSEIPSWVQVIASNAFAYNPISEVVIPEGVTTIQYDAFNGCPNLTNITIPASVVAMGEEPTGMTSSRGIANDCAKLTSVIFTDTKGWNMEYSQVKSSGLKEDELSNTSKAAQYVKENKYLSKLGNAVGITVMEADGSYVWAVNGTTIGEAIASMGYTWATLGGVYKDDERTILFAEGDIITEAVTVYFGRIVLNYDTEEYTGAIITDESGTEIEKGYTLTRGQKIKIEPQATGNNYLRAVLIDIVGLEYDSSTDTYTVTDRVHFSVRGVYDIVLPSGSNCEIRNIMVNGQEITDYPGYIFPNQHLTFELYPNVEGVVRYWCGIDKEITPTELSDGWLRYTVSAGTANGALTFETEKFVVTYLDDDRSTLIETKEFFIKEFFSAIDWIPTKQADEHYTYTFSHWTDSSGNKPSSDTYSDDITLYAVWEKTPIE